MKTGLIFAAFWVGCGLISAAGMNAHFRAEYPSLYGSERWAASHQRQFIAMGVAFGPVGLLAVAAASGLFYDGFTLSGKPVTRWRGQP